MDVTFLEDWIIREPNVREEGPNLHEYVYMVILCFGSGTSVIKRVKFLLGRGLNLCLQLLLPIFFPCIQNLVIFSAVVQSMAWLPFLLTTHIRLREEVMYTHEQQSKRKMFTIYFGWLIFVPQFNFSNVNGLVYTVHNFANIPQVLANHLNKRGTQVLLSTNSLHSSFSSAVCWATSGSSTLILFSSSMYKPAAASDSSAILLLSLHWLSFCLVHA